MKRVVIVILAVLLIGVGYLAYDKFLAENEINPWQFVPSKAAIIFEGSQTLALYDSLKNRQIWSAFASLPEIQDWDKKLSELDSVTDVPINQLFGDNEIKIAVFPVSATKLDALFIMRIISGDQRSFLKKIKTKWEVQGYRSKERLYNGFTIEEFYQRPDGPMFSLINHGDLLVGSYTPFLVEDAIRAFNEPEKLGFVAKEAEVFKLKPLDRDQGNMYINLDEFGEMARLFSDRMLNGYTGNAFLDLSISENSIKFSGFTMPAGGALSSFNTAPEAFNLLDVVPDNVAILRHYSFTNAKDWRANLKSVDKVIGRNSDELKRLYDLELDFLFDQVANEVAIADLEAVGSDHPSDAAA